MDFMKNKIPAGVPDGIPDGVPDVEEIKKQVEDRVRAEFKEKIEAYEKKIEDLGNAVKEAENKIKAEFEEAENKIKAEANKIKAEFEKKIEELKELPNKIIGDIKEQITSVINDAAENLEKLTTGEITKLIDKVMDFVTQQLDIQISNSDIPVCLKPQVKDKIAKMLPEIKENTIATLSGTSKPPEENANAGGIFSCCFPGSYTDVESGSLVDSGSALGVQFTELKDALSLIFKKIPEEIPLLNQGLDDEKKVELIDEGEITNDNAS